MECYACTNQAVRQCRRCARVYCEVHGGDLCAECMSPASALPSFNLYRGSLLALLIGTAAALWLLVQPPGTGNSRQVQLPITPSPVVTQVAETPERTPLRTATTSETATPGLPTVPRPTATLAVRDYIVQEGDTLLGIAERLAPAGVSPFDYASQIAAASGLASVDEPIAPGQRLVLP